MIIKRSMSFILIGYLSFVVLILSLFNSCASEPVVDLNLLNYKIIEQRRITPEENVKLTPMAATVLLQMERQDNIFKNWEDIVGQFMGSPELVKKKIDLSIPGPRGKIPLRIYTPLYSSFEKENLPVVLFIHGGGFISGSIKSHDNISRMLSKYSESIVVSIEYRLAPEFAYPAANDDCYAALLWIEEHISEYGGNSKKIAIAGDSAGGLLSVSMVERSIRLNGPQILFMALYYPALTFEDLQTDSRKIYGGDNGYYVIDSKVFNEMKEVFFKENFLSLSDAKISPLNIDLEKYTMPPSYIMACQCGPLRDEALLFAERIKLNGVESYTEVIPGMIHGFLNCDLLFPVEVHQTLKKSGKMIKNNFKQ